MKKTIISTEKLNSIAETFQELSGSNEPLRFDQIVEKAEEVKSQVQSSGTDEWVREPGAPNLDLLMKEGNDLASGSGWNGAYVSFYIDTPYPEDTYVRMWNNCDTLYEVIINENGEEQTELIPWIGKDHIDMSIFNRGWHILKFNLPLNTSFCCYGSSGVINLNNLAYEVYIHILNYKKGSMTILTGEHATLIDTNFLDTNFSKIFSSFILEKIDFINCNTSNVTNMSSMFQNCYNLKKLDLSSFDTSNVTNMSSMFQNCFNLKKLDLSSFDTSNVTNMSSMFQYCYNLKKLDLSSFDTSNVTNMSRMFQYCCSLQAIIINTWDTSNVTDMSSMFSGCNVLHTLLLPSFNFNNVTNLSDFCAYSYILVNLQFGDNSKHQSKDGQNTWTSSTNAPLVSNTYRIISENGALKNIYSFPSLPISFTVNSNLLTVDSLLVILNALPEVSTAQTLTIGATNKAKLTTEQIEIATEKGWTVA